MVVLLPAGGILLQGFGKEDTYEDSKEDTDEMEAYTPQIEHRNQRMEQAKCKSWGSFWTNMNFLQRRKEATKEKKDYEMDVDEWEALDTAQISLIQCKAILIRSNCDGDHPEMLALEAAQRKQIQEELQVIAVHRQTYHP